jgi:hypothetical protein
VIVPLHCRAKLDNVISLFMPDMTMKKDFELLGKRNEGGKYSSLYAKRAKRKCLTTVNK